MFIRVSFVLALLLGPVALASADSIGGPCPAGQIYQMNPGTPGSRHHGGGQCVPDPNAPAASCSTHPGASSPMVLVAMGIALLVGRNRRRDRVSGA